MRRCLFSKSLAKVRFYLETRKTFVKNLSKKICAAYFRDMRQGAIADFCNSFCKFATRIYVQQ